MRENSQARDVNTFLWNGETVESSAISLSKNSMKEILETEDPLDKFSSCGALQHTCPLEQQHADFPLNRLEPFTSVRQADSRNQKSPWLSS